MSGASKAFLKEGGEEAARNVSERYSLVRVSGESIEDSSGVPQVWRLRSDSSRTSYNGLSVNCLGDGTISWGNGTRIQAFSEGSPGVSRAIRLERGSTRHTKTWRVLGGEVGRVRHSALAYQNVNFEHAFQKL
jgi:hypothetical protein